MSIRWRVKTGVKGEMICGEMICTTMSEPEEGDIYIDDVLQYQLVAFSKAIMPDLDHANNGIWHWVHGEGRFTYMVQKKMIIRTKPENENDTH